MTKFNPVQAREGDQVLVVAETVTGDEEVTGQITKWRNHSDFIDVVIHVALDKTVAIWNEEDIRDNFCLRIGPENETRGSKKFRIIA